MTPKTPQEQNRLVPAGSIHARKPRRHARRRGAVMLKMALLLVPLFGFAAFALDVGWIVGTKGELQNASDAASLAATRRLGQLHTRYQFASPGQKSKYLSDAAQSARNDAMRVASANSAGEVANLALDSSDLELLYMNPDGTTSSPGTRFPNAASVRLRRDASFNGALPLFLAPLIGVSESQLEAPSTSALFSGHVTRFSFTDSSGNGSSDSSSGGGWQFDWTEGQGSGFSCSLLPVTFDVQDWVRFVETQYSPNGKIVTDSSGEAIIDVYPSPTDTPGNFGLLCIGPDASDANTYRQWILEGPSAEDLAYLEANDRFPVSVAEPKLWFGSPGLKSSLAPAFEAIIGQPRLMPLFEPVSRNPYVAAAGVGSDSRYSIVGFAGVEVTKVVGRGQKLSIYVRPSSVIDPSAVFDPSSIVPLGSEPEDYLKTFTHPQPRIVR